MIRDSLVLPGLLQVRKSFASVIRRLRATADNPSANDPSATGPSGDGAGWRELVAPYAVADGWRGTRELIYTAAPFLLLVAAIFYGLDHEIWAALVLVLPAAAFLVRLFIIQHDCGHGSYFRSRHANDFIGRIIGVFTLTPYAMWRQDHATHHATSGNLSRRGIGDITTLTVREYLSQPAFRRMLYRVYRHPLVLFVVGPAYQFLLAHRFPRGNPMRIGKTWLSVWGTNAALAAIAATVVLVLGWRPLVIGYLPISLLAGSIGIWMFYVQHQFENTYWRDDSDWDFQAAALEGCSLYDLPGILHWLTGHIGFHHIHHLAIRVPSYRLRPAFDAIPAFRQARRLRLGQSFGCARLTLWDEHQGKLVRFADIRA